jgi:hypothetical protein
LARRGIELLDVEALRIRTRCCKSLNGYFDLRSPETGSDEAPKLQPRLFRPFFDRPKKGHKKVARSGRAPAAGIGTRAAAHRNSLAALAQTPMAAPPLDVPPPAKTPARARPGTNHELIFQIMGGKNKRSRCRLAVAPSGIQNDETLLQKPRTTRSPSPLHPIPLYTFSLSPFPSPPPGI